MTIEKVPTVDTLTKIERRHRRRTVNDAYKWLCHRDENIAVIVWRQQLSVKLQPQTLRNLSIIYTLLKPGRFPVQYAYINEPILHRRGFYDFWTSTDRLSIIETSVVIFLQNRPMNIQCNSASVAVAYRSDTKLINRHAIAILYN